MIIGWILILLPLIYIAAAFLLKKYVSYQPPSSLYEETPPIIFLQYFLYFSGLGVFFFSDFFMHIFRKNLPQANQSKSQVSDIRRGPEHQKLNLEMLLLLDYTALSGLIGFLISGNLTWLVIFALLGFFSKFRFFPLDKKHFIDRQ